MKALVLNALGRGFDYEEVEIAAPMGREVLVEVKASGLCHTDLLFAERYWSPAYIQHSAHIAPGREGLSPRMNSSLCPQCWATRSPGSWPPSDPTSGRSVSEITS
jgi:hypothetical protein